VTKIYAICDREAYAKFKDHFCPQNGSHYIELESGRVLVLAFFHKEENEHAFSMLAGVDVLPDAFFSDGRLQAEHAEELSELGLPESPTTFHVAKAAAKRHPLMKLRSWL